MKPVKVSPKIEKWYAGKLIEIIRVLDGVTFLVVLPMVKEEIKKLEKNPDIVRDSDEKEKEVKYSDTIKKIAATAKERIKGTSGNLTEKVLQVSEVVIDIFQEPAMMEHWKGLSRKAIKSADEDIVKQFKDTVYKAIGIDISQKFGSGDTFEVLERQIDLNGDQKGVKEKVLTLDEVIDNNVNLIKTIPNEYFSYVHKHIREAYFGGRAVSSGTTTENLKIFYNRYDAKTDSDVPRETLAYNMRNLPENNEKLGEKLKYVTEENRDFIATRIARDQMSKLYSDVTRSRNLEAGVDLFKWKNADDYRVTGNPKGLYPKGEPSCWDIAQQETEYGIGIYSTKKGATWAKSGSTGLMPGKAHIQCRCVMLPVIPEINYDPETKEYNPYGI